MAQRCTYKGSNSYINVGKILKSHNLNGLELGTSV